MLGDDGVSCDTGVIKHGWKIPKLYGQMGKSLDDSPAMELIDRGYHNWITRHQAKAQCLLRGHMNICHFRLTRKVFGFIPEDRRVTRDESLALKGKAGGFRSSGS